MKKERASKIFDILEVTAGAHSSDRASFIYHHCKKKEECKEFRFSGKLGFGGKYRSETNTVDCYHEDLNVFRKLVIERTNEELSKVEL